MDENDQNRRPDIVGEAAKIGNTASSVYGIIKSSFAFIVVIAALVYFIAHGLPIALGGFFILFIIFIFALQIVRTKRIASVEFGDNTVSVPQIKIEFTPNEKIAAVIPGVLRTGAGLRSVTVLGAGQVRNPENAIIVTDNHILFIYVPLLGADKIIGSTDVGVADFLIAKKDIENKPNGMLSSMPLAEVFNSFSANFGISLTDLIDASFSDFQHQISFIMRDGTKYSYAIRAAEDYEKLKQILQK